MHYAAPIAGDGQRHLIHRNGNTGDIIRAIRMADKLNAPYVADFAVSIAGDNLEATCYNIWRWIKDNIPYNEDPEGVQMVQSPGELYKNRTTATGGTGKGGDCKSYSNFISGCLKNLGIKHFYRFIAQEPGEDFHHVYICVPTSATDYIVIDPTPEQQDSGAWHHPDFNEEYKFGKHKDVWAVMPRVAGVGKIDFSGANKIDVVTWNNPNGKADVAQFTLFGYWADFVNAYKQNFDQHKKDILNRCIKGIIFHWCGSDVMDCQGIKAVKPVAFIHEFKKNYDLFLHTAAAMSYHFWNESQYGPLPAELHQKRTTGKQLFDTLHDQMGVREGDLRAMCGIGVYMMYGVPLDYMYYRASCLVKYGQPWEPVAGIPYYNMKTGAIVNTGTTAASLALTVKIAMCFPFDGGIGRPYGVPFWTKGAFVMRNGATEQLLAKYMQQNPKPQTINNLTPAQVLEYSKLYADWMNGNMVGLPDVLSLNNRDRVKVTGIGLAIGETIAIVTAVTTAVATVLGIVARILSQAKAPIASNMLPEFKKDFKEMYQTVDGCTMFQKTTGQLMKCCPDGNCIENPNPNAPENQAAAGFFGGLGSPKTLLFLALGAIGLSFLMSNKS